MSSTMERIYTTGLVPVVVINDADTAVDTARALLSGGVDIMEITMRTEAGLESIKRVSEACPEMLVGGGTVLTMDQCKTAIEFGARFIVSPGYNPDIVQYCMDKNIAICPGCVTPTEIDTAMRAGLNVLKFFPANIYGGLKAIKALKGPFNKVRFIPTGGINLNNLAEYNDPAIYAVGGGWLCDTKLINNRDFAQLTEICKKSVDIILGLKDQNGNDLTLEALMTQGGYATTINIERTLSQLVRRNYTIIREDKTSIAVVKDNIEINVSLAD